MKCTIPEISWHNRDPVLSVDIENGIYKTSSGEMYYRVATGGADSHVLIWHLMIDDISGAKLSCVADLDRHQKAVNVVRFSPSKDILASGDDESMIILWKQRADIVSDLPPLPGDDIINKEHWTSWKILRGHLEDIYDLSWSPDSSSLVSGSVDNTVILWDVQKGKNVGIFSDYKGFVQGVSWDPCNKYICTISTDRHVRLIDIKLKKTIQRISKSKIPTPAGHALEGKTVRLFYDDTFKSFFRRLTYSPDGSFIIVPSGIIESQESSEKLTNATIIFSRHSVKEPVAILPSIDEITIAARCCPVYFEIRTDGPPTMISLPYRIVFAVATQRSVLLYDTQCTCPIGVISNIHYTRLTDIIWSSDGHVLIVSSTDGYCSIIHFQEGELGKIYKPRSETNLPDSMIIDDIKIPTSFLKPNSNVIDVDVTKFKCAQIMKKFNQSPAQKKEVLIQSEEVESSNKCIKNGNHEAINETRMNNHPKGDTEETEDFKLVYSEESAIEDLASIKPTPKITPSKLEKPLIISVRTPRRVQLITLSSPKRMKKD